MADAICLRCGGEAEHRAHCPNEPAFESWAELVDDVGELLAAGAIELHPESHRDVLVSLVPRKRRRRVAP